VSDPAPAPSKSCPKCGSEDLDRVGLDCQLVPGPWHSNWHNWVQGHRESIAPPTPFQRPRKKKRQQ
jgi:hypothetical protein